MSKALELYSVGKLKEAVAAATEAVKKAPSDAGARDVLTAMLLFAGDLERADKQLEALMPSEPKDAVGVAQYRQLVRAEQARQQFYTLGHPPSLLEPADERMRKVIEASILLREKRFKEAGKLLEEANEMRPMIKGTCNGKPFSGIRDLDDLLAGVFEVIAPNGKFYLVPMEKVESITFKVEEGKRLLRDLLWRPAHMTVYDGPDGDVYFPAVYPGSHLLAEEAYGLGRMSDWKQAEEGAPFIGHGLRMLFVGEEEISFHEIKELEIERPAGSTAVAPAPTQG
jgi:type VI secretion system protein ImpE